MVIRNIKLEGPGNRSFNIASLTVEQVEAFFESNEVPDIEGKKPIDLIRLGNARMLCIISQSITRAKGEFVPPEELKKQIDDLEMQYLYKEVLTISGLRLGESQGAPTQLTLSGFAPDLPVA